MADNLTGTLYGDKSYIANELKQNLYERNIHFVTGQRGNIVSALDKAMLGKRFIIETVFDQLKNMAQIDYTRYRSALSFMVNIIAGLIAYTFQEKKPSINMIRL